MDQRVFKKPLRYKGHDYRAPCSVHVTICTHLRQELFGSMTRAGMLLNDAGQFVETALLELHDPSAGVGIDTHMIMPGHLHAIIHLGTNPDVETGGTISDRVRVFKMWVMRSWPRGMREHGWTRYDTHLWQQSFHDTRIGNDTHLELTREYILGNPGRWLERHRKP